MSSIIVENIIEDYIYSEGQYNERGQNWIKPIILLTTDILCLASTYVFALYIYRLTSRILDQNYIYFFLCSIFLLLLEFYRRKLYSCIGLDHIEEFKQITFSVCFVYLILIVINFINKTSDHYSRFIVITSFFLSIVFFPIARYCVRNFLVHKRLWGEPVVIIGDHQKANEFSDFFQKTPNLGIIPIAFMEKWSDTTINHNILPTSKFELKNNSKKIAVIINDEISQLSSEIEIYKKYFDQIIFIDSIQGISLQSNFEILRFNNIIGIQWKNHSFTSLSRFLKRIIDIFLCILSIIIFIPLICLISVLIRLDSPGKIFYRQKRVGEGGKPFYIIKFRTMCENADQMITNIIKNNPEFKKEWENGFKLKDDPRITRIGKLLRKYSLDEVPQIINIFNGEMSIIGPRPITGEEIIKYKDHYGDYTSVKPGLTGLWQVSGRNDTSYEERVRLDSYYVNNWSIWLDFFIILETIKVIIFRKGAY